MKKIITEYDQIKDSLAIVRKLKESDLSKEGEKVDFGNIQTMGFIKVMTGVPISDDVKRELINSIEYFIENSGLILNSVNIFVEDGRLRLISNTIKNPGLDLIKSVTIDTQLENPIVSFISGDADLNKDLINFMSLLKNTYDDNQIGRNNLITKTQFKNV